MQSLFTAGRWCPLEAGKRFPLRVALAIFLFIAAFPLPKAEGLSTREQRKVDAAARAGDWVMLWEQYVDLVSKKSPDAAIVGEMLENWIRQDFLLPILRIDPEPEMRSVFLNYGPARNLLRRHSFLASRPTSQEIQRACAIERYIQVTPKGETMPFWAVRGTINSPDRNPAGPPPPGIDVAVLELLRPSILTLNELDFRIWHPQGRASPVFGGYGRKNHSTADLVTPQMAIRIYTPTRSLFGVFYLFLYHPDSPPIGLFDQFAAGIRPRHYLPAQPQLERQPFRYTRQ